ncbi:MAG: helix-turn-helix transcriptional regulator [Sphingomonas sp.]|nr:helix-turn-helix transcriptional regulator [Sphingomonas sp.]MDX3883587.1 helix-turn-helix transcriptional regulator [Sphingomonas sp.]
MANDTEAPNRIKELREAKGITQAALARLVHADPATLNKLEKGSRGLDQQWMRRIAPHLGVTPAELLPQSDNPLILSDEERDFVERYRAASRSDRDTFNRVADAVLPFRQKRDNAA